MFKLFFAFCCCCVCSFWTIFILATQLFVHRENASSYSWCKIWWNVMLMQMTLFFEENRDPNHSLIWNEKKIVKFSVPKHQSKRNQTLASNFSRCASEFDCLKNVFSRLHYMCCVQLQLGYSNMNMQAVSLRWDAFYEQWWLDNKQIRLKLMHTVYHVYRNCYLHFI